MRTHCLLLVIALAGPVHADNVFEVCKGESKKIVAGTGKLSIALVFPDDFPGRTTRQVLFPIGARLATTEKAKVILVADVDAALKLVGTKKWNDTSEACGGTAPSLNAVLGQKHPNLSTAHVSIGCETQPCELRVDLERHGRPSAERWVRYVAPLDGAKDDLKVIAAAGKKLVAKGTPPDAPTAGLAIEKLATGKVRARSDVDGALEADRIMETSAAIAACSPKQRKGPHDVRGYYAEWTLSAKGTAYQTLVKPFAGRDPGDEAAAECLKKALEATTFACPRDAKAVKVKTAICL